MLLKLGMQFDAVIRIRHTLPAGLIRSQHKYQGYLICLSARCIAGRSICDLACFVSYCFPCPPKAMKRFSLQQPFGCSVCPVGESVGSPISARFSHVSLEGKFIFCG